MNSSPKFRINKKVLTAAVILSVYPSFSYAVIAGRVEFAVGAVNAVGTDGRERPLAKGAEISAGDTIKTLDGRVQARFTDGGFISLQPNTEFKVEDYNYTGKADGSEKGIFNLLKGGLRAITGAIGHTNRSAYRVNTAVATIGIRGTEYLAQYDTKLLVKVGDGAVYLSNLAGDITLYKGQVGEVGGAGEKPKQSTETPSVNAAGPTGGTPEDTQEDQNGDIIAYIDGDVRFAGSDLCQTESGGCVSGVADLQGLLNGPLANISQLNALGAQAVYTGSSVVSIGFAPDTATLSETLAIDFSDYSTDFAVTSTPFVGTGSLNGKTVYGLASGGLDPATGIMSFSPGSLVTTLGTNVYSGGSLTVGSAALNPSNISQATITYDLYEVTTGLNKTVSNTLTGVVLP
jgi:hypothetical protein